MVSEENNLLGVPGRESPGNAAVSGWTIHLENHRQQAVSVVTLADGQSAFQLVSRDADRGLRVASAPILVEPGMKFRYTVLVRFEEPFDGAFTTFVDLVRKEKGVPRIEPGFAGKMPNLPRRGGLMLAKETFEVPANATEMRVGVRGNFKGTVVVHDICLVRVQ